MTTRPESSAYPAGRCNAGGNVGRTGTLTSRIAGDAAGSRFFPPLDRALVQAMACETVAQTGLPISRQSLADLVVRAMATLQRPIGRTTVWRILNEDALKPWQFAHWVFTGDRKFDENEGRLSALYMCISQRRPLSSKDFVLSSDEKTS